MYTLWQYNNIILQFNISIKNKIIFAKLLAEKRYNSYNTYFNNSFMECSMLILGDFVKDIYYYFIFLKPRWKEIQYIFLYSIHKYKSINYS